MQIDLGSKVKDRITGLEGIVIGRTEWLYKCVRLVVQPQVIHEGQPVEAVSFDEDQLEVLAPPTAHLLNAPENLEEEEMLAPTGGPRDMPQRRPDARR